MKHLLLAVLAVLYTPIIAKVEMAESSLHNEDE